MAKRDSLTVGRLRELLHYDPTPGVGTFTWLVCRGGLRLGAIAGTLCKGYVYVTINGVKYAGHRLAWFYMYGVWPDGQIDHRDEVGYHNWIDNLREATDTQNKQNVSRLRRSNTSGFIGITQSPDREKWRVRIRHSGRNMHIGYYDTAEEAGAAYLAAKAKLHPFWHQNDGLDL